MTKINHEEYKALKELDDELKWIARDEPGELYVYDEKPIKLEVMWSYAGLHMEWVREHEHLFQFIQWEDEEPYNIRELIEEYEYKTRTFDWVTALRRAFHGESEETEVKKDKEYLQSVIQRRIDNLSSTYEGLYIEGSRDAYELVLQDINELDEPEVLSAEWIERNTSPVDDEGRLYIWKRDLENLVIPKLESLETLTVPIDLGEWLQSRGIGESLTYFSTIDALYHYWESETTSPTNSFINDNKKELIEVILGTRGYRIETPLYCALIKGYELLDSDRFYWIYDKYEDRVFVSKLYSLHGNFLTEMSKEEWNELGINDSNAEFVRVDGVEE